MPELDFYFRQGGTRQQIRRRVVQRFLKEDPGLGSGRLTSRYRYDVERLVGGTKVYLLRPAWLKKGFDFLINVERIRFSNGKENPSHDDILSDLGLKHGQDRHQYQRLHEAIAQVYRGEDPSRVLSDYRGLNFPRGYTTELILKVLKWFWIEQDIRDWNYSGRSMLMEAIEAIND